MEAGFGVALLLVAVTAAVRHARAAVSDSLWRRLWNLFNPALVIPATAVSFLQSALLLGRPRLTGNLFDVLVDGGDKAAVWACVAWLAAVQVLDWMASIATGVLFAKARWAMTMHTRQEFLQCLLSQDMKFYDAHNSADLINRLSNEPDRLNSVVNHSLERFLRALLNVVGGFLLMFACDWRLAVGAVLLRTPLLTNLSTMSAKRVGEFSRQQNAVLGSMAAVATEAIQGVATLQAHVAEGSVVRAYAAKVAEYLAIIRRVLFAETVLRFVALILGHAVDIALTVLGSWRVLDGAITVGEYTAFRSHASTYWNGVSELKAQWGAVVTLTASCERYFDVVDRQPAVPLGDGDGFEGRPPVRGSVEFRGVWFAYTPGVPVLRGVSFHVEPGETLALVGPSGAGKSTCLRLVERFLEASKGDVLIDGSPVATYDTRALRRCIGYVSQSPTLFDLSVVDNICLGLEGPHRPSMEAVELAARQANAHDFVAALPAGYDTMVGERGARLSGGQLQRIAIARALVREPAILLLDEATAQLDAVSESLVREAIATLMAGRTTIVIAHRLSTVVAADRIAVVDDGIVVEVGTHGELLGRPGGQYREMCAQQLIDFAIE